VSVTPAPDDQAQPRPPEPTRLSAPAAAAVPVAAAVPADTGRRSGRLLVRSEPAGATVLVDGRRRGNAPLSLDGITAGSHRVEIQGDGGSIEQIVTVEANSTISLVVPLNAKGWLDVRAPMDLQIFENGVLIGTSADGPLSLGAGRYRLQLQNEPAGYRGEAEVTVSGNEVTRLRPVLPDGVLHANAQPWAQVLVDGKAVGETPLGNLQIPIGPHEVRFRHPTLGERVRQVVVTALAPARISVDFRQD
jgi:hypothetical protein